MKSLCALCISNETGISEEIKRIGNRYKFMIIFKTKHTPWSSVKKTRPKKIGNRRHSGRSYAGETGRPLAERDRQQTAQWEKLHWRNRQTSSRAARLRKRKANLQEGILGKSKLSQHAYEGVIRKAGIKTNISEIGSTCSYWVHVAQSDQSKRIEYFSYLNLYISNEGPTHRDQC
jgi:hypothetical protein